MMPPQESIFQLKVFGKVGVIFYGQKQGESKGKDFLKMLGSIEDEVFRRKATRRKNERGL